jgi:zinc protease
MKIQKIDRSIAPKIETIARASMSPVLEIENKLGLPIFVIKGSAQDILKLEFIFDAGVKRHENAVIPSFANTMLNEGTTRHNAKEIADAIDKYGAFIETDVDRDFATVSLFTLGKFFKDTLPWMLEMIFDAAFPQEEFEILRKSRIQRYQVNMEKVGFIAGKKIMELIFPYTPYQGSFELDDYTNLDNKSVLEFYRNHYKNKGLKICLSGNVTDEVLHLLKTELESFKRDFASDEKPMLFTEFKFNAQQCFIEKPKALQSAIRIGRPLFTKSHEDYFGMNVLNKILGGYFGSRLMRNIREDKGYTYGIGSGIASLQHSGYFYISTEVGAGVTIDALNEIYKEIDILQQHIVPEEELELVKQYMLGTMLKSFDGPLEQMERFKSIYLFGAGSDYYERYFDAIRNMDTKTILQLAQKYLNKSDLTELVVGIRS